MNKYISIGEMLILCLLLTILGEIKKDSTPIKIGIVFFVLSAILQIIYFIKGE